MKQETEVRQSAVAWSAHTAHKRNNIIPGKWDTISQRELQIILRVFVRYLNKPTLNKNYLITRKTKEIHLSHSIKC